MKDNELIAEFMGVKAEKEYYMTNWISDHGWTGWMSHSSCVHEWGEDKEDWHCDIKKERMATPAYDERWDNLIPVVEKIKQLYNDAEDRFLKSDMLHKNRIFSMSIMTPKDEVYQAVVSCINWINTQKL